MSTYHKCDVCNQFVPTDRIKRDVVSSTIFDPKEICVDCAIDRIIRTIHRLDDGAPINYKGKDVWKIYQYLYFLTYEAYPRRFREIMEGIGGGKE